MTKEIPPLVVQFRTVYADLARTLKNPRLAHRKAPLVHKLVETIQTLTRWEAKLLRKSGIRDIIKTCQQYPDDVSALFPGVPFAAQIPHIIHDEPLNRHGQDALAQTHALAIATGTPSITAIDEFLTRMSFLHELNEIIKEHRRGFLHREQTYVRIVNPHEWGVLRKLNFSHLVQLYARGQQIPTLNGKEWPRINTMKPNQLRVLHQQLGGTGNVGGAFFFKTDVRPVARLLTRNGYEECKFTHFTPIKLEDRKSA